MPYRFKKVNNERINVMKIAESGNRAFRLHGYGGPEMIQLDEISVPTPGPTDQPWGNRSMLFRDPDGNLINFYAPINGDKL